MIDCKQRDLYEERIDAINTRLMNSDDRLTKTGLREAYIDDFKQVVLNKIKKNYYKKKNYRDQPYILDSDHKVVLHLTQKKGTLFRLSFKDMEALNDLDQGNFNALLNGKKVWHIYKKFKPWGWTIAYTIPLDIKYSAVYRLLKTLVFLIFGVAFVILIVLSLVLLQLTKPIVRLTRISELIAGGAIDQKIDRNRCDEVGKLARSFDNMRLSIKRQIVDLEDEIDQRIKTQGELKQARNYILNIIDSMPSILISVDMDGIITRWNNAAQEITGVSTDQAKGILLSDIFPEIECNFDVISNNMKTGYMKKELRKPRQTALGIIYENITIYPLVANGVVGAVIRIDDITREYELEQQLLQSQKMDAIGQLAGGVAHDFNNMLTGILGSAQILRFSEMALNDEALMFVDTIIEAVARASDLTTKLLAFGRKDQIISTMINFNTVIDDTVTILKRTIDKKINISVDHNAVDNTVIGDYTALQNVLMNLGINASHAISGIGEIHIITENIELDTETCDRGSFDLKPGRYIKIEVRDTGWGISEQDLPKIFDPFFTTKEQGKGTGLGLSAVYGTVQNHNGAITVQSDTNIGTVFYLYFPLSEQIDPEKCVALSDDQIDHHGVDGVDEVDEEILIGLGTILLVDDDELIRITGTHMLKKMGYNVILAVNGMEAIEQFKQHQQDIIAVLMDMVMPGMNGREAYFKIREIDPDCRVIIASGFTKNENIARLKEEGLNGFIQKPFKRDELHQLLIDILAE